ncbi:outer membrane protein assembly factor BamE [Burkholderia gladioli]|uniref:Lipoprotein SmpA/OmlA domain-containing protein n=1 Tax=Burkholderia gladioli (strain BSR3) TaxID=999541 RepID=F2LSI1_BURGS|nr:outer membrane protein assembly factor BamE [Burkholderia gladioli]AEA65777.1 hypothetical protein bgla_3p0760 [Burkholderia gladioli BSR3]
MKNVLKVIAAIVIITTLSACVSAGTNELRGETKQSINDKIVQYKTTKDQIKAMFGEPMRSATTPSHQEIWGYSFARGTPTPVTYIPVVGLLVGGAKTDSKTLIVVFDENGIVTSYQFLDSKSSVRTCLLNN